MTELISEHQEFLQRFIPEGFVNEIPDSLFHYTDSRGLHGVLANRTIWLTSFKFMNDYREFVHGLEVLGKKLFELLTPDNYDKTFIEMCENIWKFILAESTDPEIKPYIFCLTKKKDHLSQWRGYGDFGKGFCIEFLVSEIESLSGQGIFFGKVQYEPSMLEALMADLVQQWLKLCEVTAKNNSNNISKQNATDLAILFLQAAYAISIKMKHEGFSEEDEWRLFTFIQKKSPKLKFRPHRFGTADYMELNIDPHRLIREIMCGPCGPDVGHLKSSIDSLPSTAMKSNFVYTKSPIPFI